MAKIGVLSDTHSFLDPKILGYFKDCDQIWHAGDIGDISITDTLEASKIFMGVHGNIDNNKVRLKYPRDQIFICEGLKIWLTHIGGYPGKYDSNVYRKLIYNPPDIFVCGHSHILKIIRDKKLNNMLVINPGAAGKQGLHKMRTIVRFEIDSKTVHNMEAIDLGLRSAI